MPPVNLADDIRAAIADHGRFGSHVHNIKISTRRKTLGMSMEPGDPGITLHIPADARPADILTLLDRNSHRLAGMLIKARKCQPDNPVKELINGAGFLWLGRSKRLRLVDDAPEPVRSTDDTGHATVLGPWLELDRAHLQHGAAAITDWYAREGTAWLRQHPQTASLWARTAPGQPKPSIRVTDIGRKRWGVHDGHTNDIRIAWQTLQLRPALALHVLAHEFTHAIVRHGKPHGPEFWHTFERIHTGARQEAHNLREEGRRIWMGDVHTTGT